MRDELDIIKNIESIYDSTTSFQILKDFERVLDELDVYVFQNWIDGELVEGPRISRHWVSCSFMWQRDKMPDPDGGKRLLDYDCLVKYERTRLLQPRKIEKPGDFRPGTRKGKLDHEPVWVVTIEMPKTLISNIHAGYMRRQNELADLATKTYVAPQAQDADVAAQPGEEGL